MEKNDIVELEIIDSGTAFEGIAKVNGLVVFVPDAIIGERVLAKIIKVNKDYAIARVEQILVSSRYRVESFCPSYIKCGGCSCQHIEYDMQLILKYKIVKNLLEKQKVLFDKIESTVGMGLPLYYRNKVQYPIRVVEKNNIIGFYSKRSHDIIKNNCCFIQNRIIDMVAKDVFIKLNDEGFVGYNEINKSGQIRHLVIRRGYFTQEIMITIVVNEEELMNDTKLLKIINTVMSKNNNIKSFYLNLNINTTNEILGKTFKHIAGEKYISDYISDFKLCIGPKSFFQVNTLQAQVLYTILKDNLQLSGSEILFDLYSGVGSIGIFLSNSVSKVYGIEIEDEAVLMANINLLENNIKNAIYVAGSVEDKIIEFKLKNIHPDVIVVDPPRKGLDLKSVEYILEFNPSKIGYVSCNPATLARDLKLLEAKYHVVAVVPVDMFPQTSSIECVCVLKLK